MTFHDDVVALLQDVGDLVYAPVLQLRDVHEAVSAGEDLHECTEVHHSLHHAVVVGADFGLVRETLDDATSLLDRLHVVRGDLHAAGVVDVDVEGILDHGFHHNTCDTTLYPVLVFNSLDSREGGKYMV